MYIIITLLAIIKVLRNIEKHYRSQVMFIKYKNLWPRILVSHPFFQILSEISKWSPDFIICEFNC